MKEERILQLLGEVDEKYIAEAAPKETQKEACFAKIDDHCCVFRLAVDLGVCCCRR